MTTPSTAAPQPHAVKDKYDVLEWDDLPQDECDMNYRLPIAEEPALGKRAFTLMLTCFAAMIVYVLLVVLFEAFPGLVAHGPGSVIGVAALFGAYTAIRNNTPRGRLQALRLAGGVLFSCLLMGVAAGTLTLTQSLLLLLLVIVASLAWLADSIASSNAWWCSAHPRISQQIMNAYREGWRGRWLAKPVVINDDLQSAVSRRKVARARVARLLSHYRLGVLWLAGAVLSGVLVGLVTTVWVPGPLVATPVLLQTTLVLVAAGFFRLAEANEALKAARLEPQASRLDACREMLQHLVKASHCHEMYGGVHRQPPWVLSLPTKEAWKRYLQAPAAGCLLSFLATACALRETWPEDAHFVVVFSTLVGVALLPIVWVAAGIAIVAGPSILAHRLALQVSGSFEQQHQCSDWDGYVARLRESRFPLERQSVWAGCHLQHGYPILVDRSLYFEHAHVVGSAGSGKTALSMTSDITQFIRNSKGEDASGGIVILDCKGDPALLHTAREEALAAGRKFRLFTNQPGRPTHGFNPLLNCGDSKLSLSETVGVIAQALDLYHGEGYGRGFFGAASKALLQAAYKTSFTFGGTGMLRPPIESFEQLEVVLRETASDPRVFQAAQQLLYVVAALTEFEQINLAPDREIDPEVLAESIHMPRLIRDGEVAYFYLVGMVDRSSVGHIARLVLYSTLAAAINYRNETVKPARVHFFADEAQCLVSANIAPLLEQARSYGVGCVLAHQNMSQLEKADGKGLLELVLANTVFKRYHALRDPDSQKYVAAASGKTNYFDLSWDQLKRRAIGRGQVDPTFACTGTDRVMRVGVTQRVGERIEIEELADMSRRLNQSAVLIERNEGLTQLNGGLVMHSDWPISKETYQRRESTPWPTDMPGTIVCERGTPRELPTATPVDSELVDKRLQEMQEKLSRKKKQDGEETTPNDPEST